MMSLLGRRSHSGRTYRQEKKHVSRGSARAQRPDCENTPACPFEARRYRKCTPAIEDTPDATASAACTASRERCSSLPAPATGAAGSPARLSLRQRSGKSRTRSIGSTPRKIHRAPRLDAGSLAAPRSPRQTRRPWRKNDSDAILVFVLVPFAPEKPPRRGVRIGLRSLLEDSRAGRCHGTIERLFLVSDTAFRDGLVCNDQHDRTEQ